VILFPRRETEPDGITIVRVQKTLGVVGVADYHRVVRKRVRLTLAALSVACVGYLGWQAMHTPGRFLSPRLVKLADGRSLKLERYEFHTGTLRYDLPNRPFATILESVLPRPLRQKITWLKPQSVSVVSPAFPGERLLSVAVTGDGSLTGRWAVSDEQGNLFDPVINFTMFEVLEIPVFPRRGKELHLHFMDAGEGNKSLADFTIPNPCPGPHPRWTAQAMPVSFEEKRLKFTLEKFSADRSRARTVCDFRVHENGQDTLNWRPVALELSDATGNHWRPWLDSRLASVNGVEVVVGFFGALWTGEGAWKMRAEFKRSGGFPEEERLRVEHIPLPEPEQILEPHLVSDLNGARVEVSKVLGSQADYNQLRRLNVERKAGWLTIVLNGKIRSLGRRLVFLEAKDEQNRPVESERFGEEFDVPPGRSPGPYLLNLKVPSSARELNLSLAVTQSRFAEFLAKPEQTASGSAL
jgi:hypothetical protein